MTGASRGIGRQTALALAGAGFDVAVAGRTLVEGQGQVAPRVSTGTDDDRVLLDVPGSLATTAAEVEALGVECRVVGLDLLSAESITAAVTALHEAWGALDLLVNNGFVHVPQQGFEDLTDEALRTAWEGNFLNQVLLTRAVLGPMLERGRGTIANMASSSATYDPPAGPGEGGWGLGYSASKAAFGRMAGAINAELGARGIRAFNIDPGFVITESGRVRGGAENISEQGGFPSADPAAAGQVIAWLATDPGAARFLGKVVWAPKLAADLAAAGPSS